MPFEDYNMNAALEGLLDFTDTFLKVCYMVIQYFIYSVINNKYLRIFIILMEFNLKEVQLAFFDISVLGIHKNSYGQNYYVKNIIYAWC